MDAAQFTEFMNVQRQMMTQLMQMNRRAPEPVQGGNINTAIVPNFEMFDAAKENYKNYIDRFTNYVKMKNVDGDKEYCKKLLLNSIGAKNFNLLSALSVPKTPTELEYDELLRILGEHLAPKKNILVAKHKFLIKYQSEIQSIAEYVASLRMEMNECDFISPYECKVSLADIFLTAQFIRGIRDNSIREQLLQSGSLKFEDILSKAVALEAAKMDARELATHSTGNTQEVNKISGNGKMIKPFHKGEQKKFQQKSSKINYEKLGIAGLCLRCGKNNHFASDCNSKKYNLKCTLCNKKGHVAKVCITSLLANGPNAGLKNKPYSKGNYTNQIQNYDSQYGIYRVVDVVYRNDYAQSNSERYYAKIYIEGRMMKFEVDSGSGYSFLPRSQFNELKLLDRLTPTNIVFRSYTRNKFVLDGKVRVTVKYNETSITDDIQYFPDICTFKNAYKTVLISG